jgi:hypothetical protein
MKKIIRLTESDLVRIIGKLINEQPGKMLGQKFIRPTIAFIRNLMTKQTPKGIALAQVVAQIKKCKYFETSLGSKYIMNEHNQVRRWKSYHQNTAGEDEGLHAWNDFVFFVDEKYFDAVHAFETLFDKFKFNIALGKDGAGKLFYHLWDENIQKWRPATWGDAYPTFSKTNPEKKTKVLTWEFTKTPTKGYHVVDVNYKTKGQTILSGFHIGNKISRIENTVPDEEIPYFITKKLLE